jgi:hypothetical protein
VNQNEFSYTPNFIYETIDWLSEAINDSPIGRPYVWLAICLAWLVSGVAIPNAVTRRITLTIAVSGALYTLGYGAAGIASDYRYIYWTMLCALIATPAIIARVILRPDVHALLRFGPLAGIVVLIGLREIVVRLI